MALYTDTDVEGILKSWYADKVNTLFERQSPVTKLIKTVRVGGKEQRFPAIVSSSGAVSADWTVAKNIAKTSNTKNAEFVVTPGLLFSVYTMNTAELDASKMEKGAYMKATADRFYGACGGFRQALGAALYGSGDGVIALTGDTYSFTATTAAGVKTYVTVSLPADAICKINEDSQLVVKDTSDDDKVIATLTVSEIGDGSIVVSSDTTVTTAADDKIGLDMGAETLPMGLEGWLPIKAGRTGADWNTFIANKFFGVARNKNVGKLAGRFYDARSNATEATQKKSYAIKQLMNKVRAGGGDPDVILMNQDDFADFTAEIEATNTYFTATSTKAKRSANVGIDGVSASFSTNYIENCYDDPYCPKGKFYILDSKVVELWSYTETGIINDGISGNNPGVQDPNAVANKGDYSPYQLNIDDYITVHPLDGGTSKGPASVVSLRLEGSYVVREPGHCGVGIFYGASPVGL